MKKRFFQICSLILTFVLLINMLPMSVFAEEFREAVADAEASKKLTPEPVQVVDEITEKRTEFSKEFLLSSGLHMAVVYPEAVHFETDNGWEDIDNTLITKADGTLTNTAGVWDVSFPQTLDKNGSVTIEKDGYTLSFSMAGELSSTGAMHLTASMDDTVQPLVLEEANPSAVQQKETDVSSLKEAAEYPETVPEKLQSGVTYNEVYEDTHITYDLDSNKVKESVILEAYKDTLQGYRYTLNVGEMIPVLGSDGQITLYDKAQENIVMVMPAPFLQDAAGEYNHDIQVLLEGSGSEYTMTYLLPTQWLAEETRSWPVVLDPVVEGNTAAINIQDVTLMERPTEDYLWGMMQVGYNAAQGKSRYLIKYDALPRITSSDVIISATLHMRKYTTGSSMQVNAHQVTSGWASSTATWSTHPSYNQNIEDYAMVSEGKYYGWMITDIVRQWYATGNNGLMLKATDAVETGGVHKCTQFYSSDYGSDWTKPLLQIMFRNNNGLEGYWDYTASSAGRAGTGYVNNFTGNLVWVREDIGFGGNLMPVTINHIYNANDTTVPSDENNANDTGGNAFSMGIGWRTNFNQLVYKWSLDSNYYIWEDADGTDHYFKLDGTVYKDEDGLELTLTDGGSGTRKYCIEDKKGNCSYFDSYGRLSIIENYQPRPSSITITYNIGRQISKITDGSGRTYTFTYSNGLVHHIRFQKNNSQVESYVTFNYSGPFLESIINKGAAATVYGYNSNGLLTTVQDVDGYTLNYEYNAVSNNWQPYRITKVFEKDGSSLGGELTFSYAQNETTITDHNGNVQLMQFNDFGNTTSIQDDEGNAQFSQYAKNKEGDSGKGNQLVAQSKLQNTVVNLIRDSSFEATGSTSQWALNATGAALARSTGEAFLGSASMKADCSSTSGDVYMFGPAVQVQPGKTYTLSAYVKTADMDVVIGLTNTSTGVTSSGDTIGRNQDWTRCQVSYTNTTNTAITLKPSFYSGTQGIYYVDCVQLEEASRANRYNLIENGDFSINESSPAYGWSGMGLLGTDGHYDLSSHSVTKLDNSVVMLTGNSTAQKRISQTVHVSGSEGDSFVFGCWAKGNSVPLITAAENARKFEIQAIFNYTDGNPSEPFVAEFNPDTSSWQCASDAMVAKKAYSSICIALVYDYNENDVVFDGIQLYKELFGSSFTYDANGNVISVVDLQKKTTTYEYRNNDLTKEIISTGAQTTYYYDPYHRIIQMRTNEGVKYGFGYDSYGNNTVVSVDGEIISRATYSSDGNRLLTSTDPAGNITTYNYDEVTNVLLSVQYPEDTTATKTNYTYDVAYRLVSVAAATNTGCNLIAEYTYANDLLASIETSSTEYEFTYGDFGLRTGVSIGSRTLATYSYTNDRNNYLSSLDYGNGDGVDYTYDRKGRLTKEIYEDGTSLSYHYDSEGNLTRVEDSYTGFKTDYLYDFTNRLVKRSEDRTIYRFSVGYTFDDANNLSVLTEQYGTKARTTNYAYDTDNRVTSVSSGDSVKSSAYDAYNRLSQESVKHGDSTILTESYTYHTTEDSATYQIATKNVSSANMNGAFTYTYDKNGNIISIRDGTRHNLEISYEYDSANQLIRHNDPYLGKTYCWTYDDAGNITSRSEYAHTTDSLDGVTPTDSVSYTYGDSNWGDLLTAYDGNTITYDEIGNPLTDGTWTYTWEHGRRLQGMTDNESSWRFFYDANGLRTRRRLLNTPTTGFLEYEYFYNNGKLSAMVIDGSLLAEFAYDADGTPLSITFLNKTYYYITNIQGDVIGIMDSTGRLVEYYAYDAWGKPVSYPVSEIGQVNPLRYRGYVYDTETGFYYVSSRYYDPEIGRFINADDIDLLGANGDFASLNLFAYCGNNPVSRADSNGYFWHIVAGAVIGGISSFASTLLTGGTVGDALISLAFGAASGALTAAIPGAAFLIDVGFGLAEEITVSAIEKKKASKETVVDTVVSVGVDAFSSLSGSESQLTKGTMNEFVKAIPKTFKGNHPKVKAPAQKVVRRTSKAIVRECGETTAEKTFGSIIKGILKTIF